MSGIRVNCFAVSADGFGAGPAQALAHPLGVGGGTVFHFVTDGLESALAAGLIDEMHVALSPVLLGRGAPLWAGLDLPALGYAVAESVAGEAATHLVIRRR